MHYVFDILLNISNMTHFLKFLFLEVESRNLKKKKISKKFWKQSHGFE